MRIHLFFAFYVIAAGVITRLSLLEWAAVLFCIALVMALEAFNTALEHLCDEVQKAYSGHIKKAKDAAAGGVLIAAIFSAIVGCMLFFRGEKLRLAWDFIRNMPILAAVFLLLVPLWILFIFRKDTKEKEKL